MKFMLHFHEVYTLTPGQHRFELSRSTYIRVNTRVLHRLRLVESIQRNQGYRRLTINYTQINIHIVQRQLHFFKLMYDHDNTKESQIIKKLL